MGISGVHACMSNTCDSPATRYLERTEGGRISVFLQRGACGPEPPRPDPTHRPLLMSGGDGFLKTAVRPYADLSPGWYVIPARVPVNVLPAGVYHLCMWQVNDPGLVASRPQGADPLVLTGDNGGPTDVSALVTPNVRVSPGSDDVVVRITPRR